MMIEKDKYRIVSRLLEQKIVAIFHGQSEYGPRALGNRSILFDPRNKNAKDIINIVKNRKWYQPFACTIMLEHVHDYFDMKTLKESPWMSFAVNCKPKAIEEVPGIVHVDNTCRVQTLTKEQNKNYYELLEEWYRQTKCPLLLNTSFNLKGEAIVETLDDAIDTVNRSDIDTLYVPNYESRR